MTVRDQVLAAAERLAKEQPIEKISLTDVAKEAGVSWPTVRRYIGNKQQLQDFLIQKHPEAEHQPLDTRSRILDSAKRVFARQGYAGATLDAIAADAGMTKGAVYWHFASKSDLFLALLKDQMQSPLVIPPERAQEVFDQHDDPEAAVKLLLAGQLNYAQTHPDWCRLYMEFMVQSREAEVQKVLSGIAYEDRQTAIKQLIHKLQEDGILRDDIDPLVVGVFWGALVDGLLLARMIDPKRMDPGAWSDQLARLLWRGLQSEAKS